MTASDHAPARARWPYAGAGQRRLLVASLLVLLGSFLPWIQVALGVTFTGLQGGGLVTLYAASLGIAGAIVRRRSLALIQAAILAVAALGIPAWQVARLWGLGGWRPGIGLVLVIAGGGLGLHAAWGLWQER